MTALPVDLDYVQPCVVQAAADYSIPIRALLAVKAALSSPAGTNSPTFAPNTPYPVATSWTAVLASSTGMKHAAARSDVCWTARAAAYVLRYEINAADGDFWKGVGRYTTSQPPGVNRRIEGVARLIDDSGARLGVDPSLIHAVVQVESAYRTDARSPKGAVGLMQVMPATAQTFGVRSSEELQSPAVNIETGTRYLRYLASLFRGDIELMLAAYNAGEGAVYKYGTSVPPYPETMRYVRDVMNLYAPTFQRRVYEASLKF